MGSSHEEMKREEEKIKEKEKDLLKRKCRELQKKEL